MKAQYDRIPSTTPLELIIQVSNMKAQYERIPSTTRLELIFQSLS